MSMDTLGKLTVTTYCTGCDDFTRGVPVNGSTLDRCTQCGRYASTDKVACAQHELRESPYPTGECPMCEMERDRRAQIQHEMTRDPRVEPW